MDIYLSNNIENMKENMKKLTKEGKKKTAIKIYKAQQLSNEIDELGKKINKLHSEDKGKSLFEFKLFEKELDI